MLNSNMSLPMKLYNVYNLTFSGIFCSTVNAVHFNVISKADKQVCALQELLQEDGLSFETIHPNMLQECGIRLGNLNFALIRIYDIDIT